MRRTLLVVCPLTLVFACGGDDSGQITDASPDVKLHDATVDAFDAGVDASSQDADLDADATLAFDADANAADADPDAADADPDAADAGPDGADADPDAADADPDAPVDAAPEPPFVLPDGGIVPVLGQLSAGVDATCALAGNGQLKCWGGNTNGQLGDNNAPNGSTTPRAVSGIANVVSISAGYHHACAVGGTVGSCWGYDTQALGNGTIGDKPVPTPIAGNLSVSQIASGRLHGCALVNGGTVQCWGYNFYGPLGSGNNAATMVPVPTLNVSNAVEIAVAGNGDHSCARIADGTVQCWGENLSGQLGRGTFNQVPNPTAAPMLNVTNAVQISLGAEHTCVLVTGGLVRCTGNNQYAQFGLGGTGSNSSVVTLTETNVVQIAAGNSFTCLLNSAAEVKCAGYNLYSQCGQPKNPPFYEIKTFQTVLVGAVAIAAGEKHACAKMYSGLVKCWGDNGSGQLGNGTKVASSTPVTVVGL